MFFLSCFSILFHHKDINSPGIKIKNKQHGINKTSVPTSMHQRKKCMRQLAPLKVYPIGGQNKHQERAAPVA